MAIAIMRRLPTVEYTEDGSVKINSFPSHRSLKNHQNDFVTTTKGGVDNSWICKGMIVIEDVNRLVFHRFENTIENELDSGISEPLLKSDNDQFEEISELLSFSKTDWAKIFGVSRVTIYDWLNRKTSPTGHNAEKIRSLFKILNSIPGEKAPISQPYLYQNITKYNKSLIEIFLASQDIEREYHDIGITIAALINQSRKNMDRLIRLAKTKQSKDEILNHNLKNLSI